MEYQEQPILATRYKLNNYPTPCFIIETTEESCSYGYNVDRHTNQTQHI